MDKTKFIIEKYRCSVCDNEEPFASLELEGEAFGKYAGRYCMVCLAKWINEHIPKLEPIKDKELL